jgi:hypothetical protein
MTIWVPDYTERAFATTDEAEINRIRAYIAKLRAELARVRAQDPVEFWWDQIAKYQKLMNPILVIKPSKRTDAQIATLERYKDQRDEAVQRYRVAREPKRTWLDITGDIVWAQTELTQAARTGPGSFSITLKGNHEEFQGGEEIRFEIDDLRSFGGWVTGVERGFFFEDMASPKTVLVGTDYNILFDRLAVRNYPAEYTSRDSAMVLGPYLRWPDFDQGTMDDHMIDTILGEYCLPDLPLDFSWSVNRHEEGEVIDSGVTVQPIATPAPVSPWVMPESGSTLRRSFQSISQITTGVWYIDATMTLHYHDRGTITAPYPITDGLGGISSRDLKVTFDINNMINDVLIWGTLANSVEGEIMVWHEYGDIEFWRRYYTDLINRSRAALAKIYAIPPSRRTKAQKRAIVTYKNRIARYTVLLADFISREWDPLSGKPRPKNAIVNSIRTWGRWQMGEMRQEIHHEEWLKIRGHSTLVRYDEPIIMATATVFEPGYQAGQVVNVKSSAHGIDTNLVIRQMKITFAVAKEPHDGFYYAYPRYELVMGLEPEAPWNIYDYLPYPGEATAGLGGDVAGG